MSLYTLSQAQREAAFAHNQGFDANQRLYASGENLAKTSYDLTHLMHEKELPKEVALLEQDGRWKDYKPHALKVNTKGLYGFVLIPKDKASKEVKIVFRGTMGRNSLRRDIEVHGPGAQSMLLEKDGLLNQVSQIVDSSYGQTKGLKVTVAGHSLGASDAENFSAYMTSGMANHGRFKQVSSLEVFSFNSPGIPHKVSEKSVRDARKCLSQNPAFKIKTHYGKSEHDAVQQLGENHLFNGLRPDEIETTLIEMKKDSTISQFFSDLIDEKNNPYLAFIINAFVTAIDAHKLTTFFTPDEEGKITFDHTAYKYLNNQIPGHDKEIMEELNDKIHGLLSIYKYILSFFIDDIALVLESEAVQNKILEVPHANPPFKEGKPLTMSFDRKLSQAKSFIQTPEHDENTLPNIARLRLA